MIPIYKQLFVIFHSLTFRWKEFAWKYVESLNQYYSIAYEWIRIKKEFKQERDLHIEAF